MKVLDGALSKGSTDSNGNVNASNSLSIGVVMLYGSYLPASLCLDFLRHHDLTASFFEFWENRTAVIRE